MKTFFVSVIALVLFATEALAANALPVRKVYADLNLSSTSYQTLVSSTVQGVGSISVLNTGAYPVKIAQGAAGSEINMIQVPGTINGTVPAQPVVLPLKSGYGIRWSVIAVNGTNSTGELDVNLFYN